MKCKTKFQFSLGIHILYVVNKCNKAIYVGRKCINKSHLKNPFLRTNGQECVVCEFSTWTAELKCIWLALTQDVSIIGGEMQWWSHH